jgi:uncharacterized protein YaaW (UPF0174 family)
MTQRNYSAYQQKIISNYYKNMDTIALSRLQDLVGQLYLAQTESQQDKLWKRAQKAMDQLKIPEPVKNNILRQKNVEVLAKNLQEWLGRTS